MCPTAEEETAAMQPHLQNTSSASGARSSIVGRGYNILQFCSIRNERKNYNNVTSLRDFLKNFHSNLYNVIKVLLNVDWIMLYNFVLLSYTVYTFTTSNDTFNYYGISLSIHMYYYSYG